LLQPKEPQEPEGLSELGEEAKMESRKPPIVDQTSFLQEEED